MIQLKDICDIYDCPHTTAKDEGKGYPLVRTPNVGKGRLILNGIHRVSEDVYNSRNARAIPEEDDLILAREAPVGNVSIIMDGQRVCLGQRVVLIKPKRELVDPHFLTYYLLSAEVQHRLKNHANGAVVAHLNVSDIRNLWVTLPEFEEQVAIGKILRSIDDKIELNRQINDNLEQQAQALYRSWFVDFEPFKEGKFIESEIGEIPAGWSIVKFGDIVEIPKKTINPQKFPDTIFNHYSLPACDNGLIAEVQAGKDIMSNKIILQSNTTLFSKLNPRIKRIWFTCEVLPNSICSTEFIPYRAKIDTEYSYIFSIVNSDAFYSSVMGCVNGATGSHQRFHAEDTEDFLCAYNKDAVNEFSKLIEPILKQMHDLRQENVKLALTRDTLLPKLMSGELKINEIDC